MRREDRNLCDIGVSSVLCFAVILLLAGTLGFAQEEKLHQVFQAQAMGQGTQLGRTANITIHIQEHSTAEEQQLLLKVFQEKGNEGVYHTLDKMKAKGHIAITGTLGYNVAYVQEFVTGEVRKIRMLADRPLAFGEVYTQSRSTEYSLTGLELVIYPDHKKNTGVLLPLLELKTDKKTGHLSFNLYQNPWKLVNVMDRTKKKKK